jgi:hypothetical protein
MVVVDPITPHQQLQVEHSLLIFLQIEDAVQVVPLFPPGP